MGVTINRIIIYTKSIEKMAAFYNKYFNFNIHRESDDRIVELLSPDGGASIMLHPAGKGVKEGQACVKLVFDIKNVEQFKAKCLKNGLKFGALHKAEGYVFSNAKVPGKNSIQISSRAFKKVK